MGKSVVIGDSIHIGAYNKITIGDNVLIASKVFITDHLHGNYSDENYTISKPGSNPNKRDIYYKTVEIGSNVWIGENVSILPGVIIGEGSIIGANAVVTKNIPNNSIVAGNPAKVIRQYDEETNLWKRHHERMSL